MQPLNWLRNLFNKADTLEANPSGSRMFFAGRTYAGVNITPDSALKTAAVWACVQYITKAVSQLPWRVMKEDGKGGSEMMPTHPVDWMIYHRPCPDMGSFSWRQAMLGTALLWGNAYAEIERDNRNGVYALWPIYPDRVCVRRGPLGLLEYEVWNGYAGRVIVPQENMFHIRGFGDGPVGYNVVEYAAQSIGWAQATEIFGSTSFSEGMNPSGIVETPQSLSAPALTALKDELKRLYYGVKGDRTVILDAGMKFQKLAATLDDSQFVETRQHQIDEICRWFSVPPHKVMHLLRSTFNNIEHQSIEVVVDTVTPWVKIFEEEANYKLFGPQNRQGFFTKMNLRGLLRGDNASRAQYYKELWSIGALTVNDILGFEDMNGIGPDGDTRFVQNVYIPLDQALDPAGPANLGGPDPNAPPLTQQLERRVYNKVRN